MAKLQKRAEKRMRLLFWYTEKGAFIAPFSVSLFYFGHNHCLFMRLRHPI